MVATAALLWFAKDLTYPSSVIETAARYDRLWLLGHDDQRGSSGPDYASIDATIAQIRAAKPCQKIGLYVGGLAFKAEIDPPSLWLTDADLLHSPSGAPLSWLDAAGSYSGGDPFTYRLPNLGSPAVQTKLIDGYCQLVRDHRLDGILIDGYDPTAYASYVANAPTAGGMFGCATGCAEGAWHQPSLWMAALAQFGERLRWSLEQQGCQFIVNGIHPYPDYNPSDPTMAWFGKHRTNQVDRASGAMMEAVHLAYSDATAFVGIIEAVQLATAKRRAVFMLASPFTSLPATLDVQRFFLGLHLLVQEPPYTSFGYHPKIQYRAWDGATAAPSGNPYVFWSNDWDLDLGYPLTPAVPLVTAAGAATAVWGRWYQAPSGQCLVLVNPADAYQLATLEGTYREWHPVSGAIVDQAGQAPLYRLWLAPKTARVLFKAAA